MRIEINYVRDTEYGTEKGTITLVNGKGEITHDGRAILDLIENHGEYLSRSELEEVHDEIQSAHLAFNAAVEDLEHRLRQEHEDLERRLDNTADREELAALEADLSGHEHGGEG